MFFLELFLIILFLITAYLIYFFYIGPSKIEREIKKAGGIHPCFYCKKEIHISETSCRFCRKPNYKGLRKNRLKYFFIAIFVFALGLSRLYNKISVSFF